jgi:hypothetical protein
MQPVAFLAHAIIDADGSIVPASDCTQGADFTHTGTFGFHPLVVSLANTQEVLFLENRPGSRPSHEGAARRLDEAVEVVRRAGFQGVTLRGDTDFSQTHFLDEWDRRKVDFVFGYDCRENLINLAESLGESAWRPLRRKGYEIKTQPRTRPENVRERVARDRHFHNLHLVHEHVCEFEYSPAACKKTYRMVVVRKLVTHEQGQDVLFPETRYFFYITNKLHVSAREIVRLANTRCDQERVIGQLKSGVGALRSPLDNLFSNWAYMVIATLAWNLTRWFALLMPETGPSHEQRVEEKRTVLRMNFATFVDAFILIPAQVLATGRRVVVRLLSWNPWQLSFFRVLDAVRLLE